MIDIIVKKIKIKINDPNIPIIIFLMSKLKISNFKVSKVPALTQLLTLASLQGIADTLSGEGIRFTDLEMDFNLVMV